MAQNNQNRRRRQRAVVRIALSSFPRTDGNDVFGHFEPENNFKHPFFMSPSSQGLNSEHFPFFKTLNRTSVSRDRSCGRLIKRTAKWCKKLPLDGASDTIGENTETTL